MILGPRFVVWLLKKEVAHDCKRLEGNRLHRAGGGKGVDKNGFLSAELFSEFARGEQEEIFRPGRRYQVDTVNKIGELISCELAPLEGLAVRWHELRKTVNG